MAHDTERLALNVLRRDKEALRRLAAREGEAMAVVVRRLIRNEAQRHGLWKSTESQGVDQDREVAGHE
jgi:hypothetical protein